LVLSRDTGSIVQSSGLVTDEDTDERDASAGMIGSDNETKGRGTRKAEDVARLVWNFVQSAGEMIVQLNGDADETKLLRIRTKKNELVIVPDSKFLLVVIHDTPPA